MAFRGMECGTSIYVPSQRIVGLDQRFQKREFDWSIGCDVMDGKEIEFSPLNSDAIWFFFAIVG